MNLQLAPHTIPAAPLPQSDSETEILQTLSFRQRQILWAICWGLTAREAGNMVDLDNNPTKLIEIVGIGKQLLMTRGALTTFSISNDVAKYFAILPAIFVTLYPGLGALNVMGLASPESAILSALVFNAIIIPLLGRWLRESTRVQSRIGSERDLLRAIELLQQTAAGSGLLEFLRGVAAARHHG